MDAAQTHVGEGLAPPEVMKIAVLDFASFFKRMKNAVLGFVFFSQKGEVCHQGNEPSPLRTSKLSSTAPHSPSPNRHLPLLDSPTRLTPSSYRGGVWRKMGEDRRGVARVRKAFLSLAPGGRNEVGPSREMCYQIPLAIFSRVNYIVHIYSPRSKSEALGGVWGGAPQRNIN